MTISNTEYKKSFDPVRRVTYCVKCGEWLDLWYICPECQFDNEYEVEFYQEHYS